MKKCLGRLAAVLCSTALLFPGNLTLTAGADDPNQTYNYDLWDEAVPSQAGYIAERSVSGTDLGTKSFDEPSDIFCENVRRYLNGEPLINRLSPEGKQLGFPLRNGETPLWIDLKSRYSTRG